MARLCFGLGALALSTTGCLITDTPQFTPQTHTAPFLVAASASPDPRTVVIVDTQNLVPVTFAADVVSQDDLLGSTGAFQKVYSRLYLDYGVPGGGGLPFPYYPITGETIDPGTLEQTTGRRVSALWYPHEADVSLGCHTATLIVSHIFDDQPGCPVCAGDSSMLTWQVLRCDSSMVGNCNALPVTGPDMCQPITTGCPTVETDAGSSCPGLTDGGAM